ncbi:hypothetical protein [Sphingomonas sp. S2-65]|uniref:hypothetical protein n=1 Tax=Sphingomonas sp. S2-65 TaxID=2903960 RepID=UPI001F1ED961|nr:hypothetical protein [Sphingomonas sp. S2-65]UYY59644.1 hypothetical protein LZ586_06050 [Sphingomonas sp. S2-65]
MAVTIPRRWWAAAGAGAFAVLMPALLLIPHTRSGAGGGQDVPPPLEVRDQPALGPVYERALFTAPVDQAEAALPGDAPALVGVVGRLGDDAVALVRGADGATRTLQIGESVDGWQLAALAIDAAFFTRGAQRVRVPLPAG